MSKSDKAAHALDNDISSIIESRLDAVIGRRQVQFQTRETTKAGMNKMNIILSPEHISKLVKTQND